jgi:cytochrome P450
MPYQKRIERGPEPMPKGKFIEWSGGFAKDPFKALEELGARPLFWADLPQDVDGYWVATRFEDVKEILQDAITFSSVDTRVPYQQLAEPLMPSEVDPPDTQKLRNMLMPHMTAAKIGQLERKMHVICREIIEGFLPDGHCDLVNQFARIFPITIFTEWFGLPADQAQEYRKAAKRFLHDFSERESAWWTIQSIIREQVIEKRRDPKDDLLSAIAIGEIDGELISLQTAINVASTVFVGGFDTLPSNIGWSLRFLAQHPEYRQQLIDQPKLMHGAAEEFLRLYSVANPFRRVTRDMDFRGANLVAGDRILVSIAAANRDAEKFGEKIAFDRTVNPHIAFATGPHRCLGSHLARHELRIALETWLELIPHYRISETAKVTYSGQVLGIESLPVEWDV